MLHRATQRVDFLTTDRVLVGGRAVLGETERVLEVHGRTLAAAAIRHRVARDRVQPRQEGLALPAVAVDVRESTGKDVAREVLGVAGLTDAVKDVAVHRVDVRVVEVREGGTVATPSALDDVRHRTHLLEGRKRVDSGRCGNCQDVMGPQSRPQRCVRRPYRPEGRLLTRQGYQNRDTETRFGRAAYEKDPRTGTYGASFERPNVSSSESERAQIFCLRISIALSTAVASSAWTSGWMPTLL